MPDDIVGAFERTISRIGLEEWNALSHSDRSDMLYLELCATPRNDVRKNAIKMPDDEIIAYERALGLVGVEAWENLSDTTRYEMLDEQLARLPAEKPEPPVRAAARQKA